MAWFIRQYSGQRVSANHTAGVRMQTMPGKNGIETRTAACLIKWRYSIVVKKTLTGGLRLLG